MLITRLIVGVVVNLYLQVPAADQGNGLGTALSRALTSPPATLAAHAALGTLLLVAAVKRAGPRPPGTAQAGDRGRGHRPGCHRRHRGQRRVICQRRRAGASMAMAALTGVALLRSCATWATCSWCARPDRSRPG
jgi:hypothetical protein